MDIKLKMYEIVNINAALKAIIDDTTTKVDALLKFKLLGLMKALEPSVSNFDVIKNEKIVEYGEHSDDGTSSIKPENTEAMEKFRADINKVLESEVTVNIDKLKASDVFDKGVKADQLMTIYSLIEVE